MIKSRIIYKLTIKINNEKKEHGKKIRERDREKLFKRKSFYRNIYSTK